MSSVTSSFAQKSGRTKFFLCTSVGTAGSSPSTAAAFYLPASTVIPKSTISQDNLNNTPAGTGIGATATALPTQGLYKDLGREIVVFDDNVAGHPVTEVFREVTVMRGRDTEGLESPALMFFAKVFSSVGSNVMVSRTG